MRHVIFTSSDAKYGDFLINHWYKSLRESTDLSNIDVIILDYGLNRKQRNYLLKNGARVVRCEKDGHVTSIRFRDMAEILKKIKYDQVLSVDGGDIIFQKDIRHLFEQNKSQFRAVYDDFNNGFGEIFIGGFRRKDRIKIRKTLKNRRMVNAGVLFGPADRFLSLCEECTYLIVDKSGYGPDQVAIDYILHRDGFKPMEKKYNFVISITKDKFFIRNGKFYFKDGREIYIVHNTGNVSLLRVIEDFGYGKRYNKVNYLKYYSLRYPFMVIDFFRIKKKRAKKKKRRLKSLFRKKKKRLR